MSDISEFAEWEAQQHQQDPDEAAAGLSERQQKLIDMAHEHRVWPDRDSSNDFRSSESGSHSQDRDGAVKCGGSAKGAIGNGNWKRAGRSGEIPGSTQRPQSQKIDSDGDEEEEVVSCDSFLGKWRGFALQGERG
jgi:hypothetical protein